LLPHPFKGRFISYRKRLKKQQYTSRSIRIRIILTSDLVDETMASYHASKDSGSAMLAKAIFSKLIFKISLLILVLRVCLPVY